METMLFLDQTPFYVVTNKSGHKGASAILNKKMLSEFGKKYNINKVVVIPSSIHEMFILSADILESVGMKELTKMVQYVNKNEVSDKEHYEDYPKNIEIRVDLTTPEVSLTISANEATAGKTISVSAKAENPYNRELNDVPEPVITYQIGQDGQPQTVTNGAITIPKAR